jgi:hypothetical protein
MIDMCSVASHGQQINLSGSKLVEMLVGKEHLAKCFKTTRLLW